MDEALLREEIRRARSRCRDAGVIPSLNAVLAMAECNDDLFPLLAGAAGELGTILRVSGIERLIPPGCRSTYRILSAVIPEEEVMFAPGLVSFSPDTNFPPAEPEVPDAER